MSEKLTFRDFYPYLHTKFQVTDMGDYNLELSAVADLSNTQLEQFSLIFSGIASPWLPQGLYKLAHPQMGQCELFLVPNGPDNTGMRYEASFSRFIHGER